MPKTLLTFLNTAQKIKQDSPEWPNLDPLEDRLLHRIAVQWFNKQPVTVLTAIDLIPEVSKGTAHSKIISLIKKGVIQTNTDLNDRRVKNIVSSKLTTKYFSKFDNFFNNNN